MSEPHSDQQRAASDTYDLVDYQADRTRGKSNYNQGVFLEQNPYPFGDPPGNAAWHAWREGWFMAHGKRMWERDDG